MPANLLLLPLLGGFWFLHLCHRFRFLSQQLDGYRLLLYASTAGVIFLVIARAAVVLLHQLPGYPWVVAFERIYAPTIAYAGTGIGALFLGPVAALIWNQFVDVKQALANEIARSGNSFLKLLHRANSEEQMVSVTLSNRKWYVGLIDEVPNLRPNELYFSMVPVMSGYRDSDSLQTVATVFYEEALSSGAIEPKDLAVLLPFADVKMATLFNPDVYGTYFGGSSSSHPVVIETEPGNAPT